MTTEKKKKAAVAGLVVAAALAGSITGGPAPDATIPMQGETRAGGTFGDALTEMEKAVNGLVGKGIERGMDIPAPSESYTPGIQGVVDGLDGMAPTTGTTQAIKVSKEGTLYTRDRLRVCKEFTATDQLRFATGGVKILATARSTVGATEGEVNNVARIAVLFTQGETTKLKTIDLTSAMAMGNTVVILEDEALTAASMVMDRHNRCYIAYNRDGDGVLTAVQCGQNRLNTLLWTDLWMDGGDPDNICLAVDPIYNEAAVCCTRLPQGATQDKDREAVFLDMTLKSTSTQIEDLGEEIVLTSAAQPSLYGIDYDTDAFARGWDMEYANLWYENPDEEDGCNALFITYPTSDNYRRGIIHLQRDRTGTGGSRPKGPSSVRGYQMSQVYGSLPCVDMAPVCTDEKTPHLAAVAVAHGVTKQSGDSGAGATKSRVELEIYAVTRDEQKPFLLWWRVSDNWYNTNISSISVGQLTGGVIYFSFARGNTLYAALVDIRADGSVQGPLVNVGTIGTFGAVETAYGDRAVLIYDTPAGDGYLRILQADQVVAETDGIHFDGTALEGGTTGQTIRADITWEPEL